MERVSDEVLEGIINDQGNIIAGSWNAIHYLLIELQARRKAEKEHGYTSHGTSEKDGVGATQEREKTVLPIPCTVGIEECTVKQWFQKINEELDELKVAVNLELDTKVHDNHHQIPVICVADEAADTITAITSMLEAMGIDEQMRQDAQRRVNERNMERGRIGNVEC